MVTFHQPAKTPENFRLQIRWLVVQHPHWGPSQQMYQAIADPDKNPLSMQRKTVSSIQATLKSTILSPVACRYTKKLIWDQKGGMHDTSFTLCWSFRKENGQFFAHLLVTKHQRRTILLASGTVEAPHQQRFSALLGDTQRGVASAAYANEDRDALLRKGTTQLPFTTLLGSCLGAAKYISIKNAFLKNPASLVQSISILM